MGAHINPTNQNSKRLSIPDLILVDVFTAIYFVLVTIANSRMAFAGSHDCLHLFQFWLQGIPHRDRTQVLFAMESSGVCDFP